MPRRFLPGLHARVGRQPTSLGILLACCLTAIPTWADGSTITTIVNPSNNHSYHLLTTNTWTASEAEAVSLGGHLVTINDVTENDWVFNNFANFGSVSRSLWIGLNDVASEGTFVWVSGEPVTYTNFAAGEPNNNGDEDYVHFYTSLYGNRWNDATNIAANIGETIDGVAEVVPEPSALLLGLLGLAGLGALACRRRKG
jgi:MYXO-CTERM domain-containing protein